jgi:hypothetical protein
VVSARPSVSAISVISVVNPPLTRLPPLTQRHALRTWKRCAALIVRVFTACIDSIRKLCATHRCAVFYHPSMINAESNPTRTLTLVLPEADWKALRAAEPDAIGWLRAQIQNRLAVPSAPWSARSNPTSTTPESWWGNEDEY